MQSIEVIKSEGLDDQTWYIVFGLLNGKRQSELLRTTNKQRLIDLIESL